MTWLVLLLLSWLWAGTPLAQLFPMPGPGRAPTGGGGGGFTDSFTGTNGASLGANWTNSIQTMTILNNAATGTAGQDSMAGYTAQNLGLNHYSQVTLSVLDPGNNLGPCVRVSGTGATATAYCYFAYGGSDQRDLYRIVNSGFALVTSCVTCGTAAVGDILKLAVTGTAPATITLTRNGSLDTAMGTSGVVTDSTTPITTGTAAGIFVSGNIATVDNFVCNTGS